MLCLKITLWIKKKRERENVIIQNESYGKPLFKTKEGRKRVEDKKETKNKGNKQNSTESTTTQTEKVLE